MNVLIEEAKKARANAYAPYSVYQVGAAILGADGRIYVGCNVENVSYGVTICAERNALGNMVAEGCREIRAVAVVTRDGGTPCGLCRQALWEFTPQPETVQIICANDSGTRVEYTLASLLPHAFRSELKNQ